MSAVDKDQINRVVIGREIKCCRITVELHDSIAHSVAPRPQEAFAGYVFHYEMLVAPLDRKLCSISSVFGKVDCIDFRICRGVQREIERRTAVEGANLEYRAGCERSDYHIERHRLEDGYIALHALRFREHTRLRTGNLREVLFGQPHGSRRRLEKREIVTELINKSPISTCEETEHGKIREKSNRRKMDESKSERFRDNREHVQKL